MIRDHISLKSGKHDRNQDSLGYWSRGPYQCFVLADGMGGFARGEVASNTVVSEIEAWFQSSLDFSNIKDEWLELLNRINTKIHRYGLNESINIGSTVVLGLIDDSGTLFVTHVGDSRLYLWDGKLLSQVTEDHTVLNRDLRAKRIRLEDAHLHPQRHVLLQAIGTNEKFYPSFYEVTRDFVRVLLCSDGFHNLITDDELCSVISAEFSLENCTQMLRDRGESDDISVVIIDK